MSENDKITKEIEVLKNRIYQIEKRLEDIPICTCPPWYKQYLQESLDPGKDTIYTRGAGWCCPIHGEIRT